MLPSCSALRARHAHAPHTRGTRAPHAEGAGLSHSARRPTHHTPHRTSHPAHTHTHTHLCAVVGRDPVSLHKRGCAGRALRLLRLPLLLLLGRPLRAPGRLLRRELRGWLHGGVHCGRGGWGACAACARQWRGVGPGEEAGVSCTSRARLACHTLRAKVAWVTWVWMGKGRAPPPQPSPRHARLPACPSTGAAGSRSLPCTCVGANPGCTPSVRVMGHVHLHAGKQVSR